MVKSSIYNFLEKLEENDELEFAVKSKLISESNYKKFEIYKRYLRYREKENITTSYMFTAIDFHVSDRWVEKSVGFMEGKVS